ncbi:MAG: ammonia-forming cytochrome c nitrite reductase subunit c552 [Spirochaetota bacterium]
MELDKKKIAYISLAVILVIIFIFVISDGCAPDRPEMVQVIEIPDDAYGTEEWAKVYPLEYESWKKTKDPRPAGKSFYKKGWDTDKVVYDKLSEYPFMALLFNGWGFGIEYNEPRGHWYMRIDQDEIDPSRVGAGGVCLNCKSPYMDHLAEKHGKEFLHMEWEKAIAKIPEEHRDLGSTCYDCHNNEDMSLRTNRVVFTEGLERIGRKEFTRQEMRSLVCAQCHVTYNIQKDRDMKSVGIEHPWAGSSWGNISMENIIAYIKNKKNIKEWTQSVTGFKLAYIRHPEFEFFTRQSEHFNAGVACADCHMPYKVVGGSKISDHNVMSPLKDDLHACAKCHPQSKDRLREQVKAIQDRTVSLLLRAGYQVSVTAKIFEQVHQNEKKGIKIRNNLYARAKDFYQEAFYRVLYIGAENSIGFHNPTEAGRILGDAVNFAARAEALLRQGLAQKGIQVAEYPSLDLSKYLDNRGVRKLDFKPEQEFEDPFGLQKIFLPRSKMGL